MHFVNKWIVMILPHSRGSVVNKNQTYINQHHHSSYVMIVSRNVAIIKQTATVSKKQAYEWIKSFFFSSNDRQAECELNKSSKFCKNWRNRVFIFHLYFFLSLEVWVETILIKKIKKLKTRKKSVKFFFKKKTTTEKRISLASHVTMNPILRSVSFVVRRPLSLHF